MGRLDSEMRCKVPVRYGAMFEGNEETLTTLMRKECGKKEFGTALQFLALDPVSAEALMLKTALSDIKSNETLLHSIAVGRSNREMTILKKKYFDMFAEDLSSTLDIDFGAPFEAIIPSCFRDNESRNDVDGTRGNEALEDDGEELLGDRKLATNEKGLPKLFGNSPNQCMKRLRLLNALKNGCDITEMLEAEMGGQLQGAAAHFIGMMVRPYDTIAGLIDKACAKKFGTNELLLTCTLIRYQCVLPQVNKAHMEAYGNSIKDRIQDEVRGVYRKLLLEIIAVGMGE
jgi:hypothetical protein